VWLRVLGDGNVRYLRGAVGLEDEFGGYGLLIAGV